MRPWRTTFIALFALASAAALAAPPQSQAPVRVDRIEILGVTVVDHVQIEEAIEVAVNDELERAAVVRSAERLRAIYRARGYQQATVQSELARVRNAKGGIENTVRFLVVEGLPTRIASAKVVSSDPNDKVLSTYWQRNGPRLNRALEIASGDVLDETRLTSARRSLLNALAVDEFVGASAEDLRITPAKDPPAGEGIQAARWVDLELRVQLGDRLSFGFRGNKVFSISELKEFVEEQRQAGFGKDYLGAIRKRIEQEYKSIGYLHVVVNPVTFERPLRRERHVTFLLEEGPRVRIDRIDFEGNLVFSQIKLREEFLNRAPELIRSGIYVDEDIDRANGFLVEWMRSQGYLSARVITVSRNAVPGPGPDGARNLVRPTIYLFEGDQTLIKSVTLKGITILSPEAVSEMMGVKAEAPLNLFALNEGIEHLKTRYRALGYLSAYMVNEGTETVVQYSKENRQAEVYIEFDEGLRYKAGRIEIEGLSRTEEEVARREVQIEPEEYLEEAKITGTEEALRKLGIFSSVQIRLEDDLARPGYKHVHVVLEEAPRIILAAGIGFRNDQGIRVFGQTAYTNLWRRNHSLSLDGKVNRRLLSTFCSAEARPCFIEGQLTVGYTWPWFLIPELFFRPRLSIDRTRYRRFDTDSLTLSLGWERLLMSKPNLSVSLTYSLERSIQANSETAADNQGLRIGSITPAVKLDLRNDPLAPTRGYFGTASLEVASPKFLSQDDPPVGYTRFQWRNDGFIPITKDITWFVSFRTGLARNTESPLNDADISRRLPLSKQFTLGGIGSVRGFQEQAINLNDIAIRGTMSYVNYRTQLDLPLAGDMHFGPFFDAANLLENDYSLTQALRYGSGLGFRYQSPVGPVNFDLGFNLEPKLNEDLFQFYFSIGVI